MIRQSVRRSWLALLVASALVVASGALMRPPATIAATSPFVDILGTPFEADIDWLFAEGITVGCHPNAYCPGGLVTRGQMASFLVRMFGLSEGAEVDAFSDDDGTTHEPDINRLAHAGITVGCTPTTFCPSSLVSRGEMASFIVRAIPLSVGAGDDYFRDDDRTTHEADIDRLAAAGITTGCGTWSYCPRGWVTREQMAAFLHRIERPLPPPPHPAPMRPTLYVATTGDDVGNPCRVEADPCRTIQRALSQALDDESIEIGAGTFDEDGLTVGVDLIIAGHPNGGTTIDASGGGNNGILTIPAGRTVTLVNLTLVGGHNANGGAISNKGNLSIDESTIAGNTATFCGGAISSSGSLEITATTITGNSAQCGGAIKVDSGSLTVTNSTLSENRAIVSATAQAGAIWAGFASTITTIINSTITGNSSLWRAGGIVASDLRLLNTIVAGNAAPSDPDIWNSKTTNASSIVGVPTGLDLADILDPAGLADNGGPTETIALADSADNPALGAGNATICGAEPVNGLDQRGLPRTSPCDIGSYELQP